MFCIVAFVVLSIMGIFSASNRSLAKEAMDCVGRRVTLRPCNTGFDEKMKAKILGIVIVRSEGAAAFLNRFFEPLSWAFFILMLTSTLYVGYSLFQFYTTGNCNGLNSTAVCVFDPTGANGATLAIPNAPCYINPPTETNLTLEGADLSSFPVLNPTTAGSKVIFIGSYGCDNTRTAYPAMRELAQKYSLNMTYADYPTKENNDYLSKVDACVYKASPDTFWKLNDALFTTDKSNLITDDKNTVNISYVEGLMSSLGLDVAKMNTCINSPDAEAAVQKGFAEIAKTKIFGTPTIFIDGEAFVGPKPYRVYAIKLKGLLYWIN